MLVVVLLGWVYEACAIWLGSWPTLTDVIRQHRDSPLVVIGVCAFTGWIWQHLLVASQ
jgi:hypothetical protein